jgi:hypothetical protein
LAKLPNKRFTYSGSMISLKLGSPSGGVKAKVVLFGSVEDSSGLASCPNMIDASISYSIVLPILVSSETILSLRVELAHVFWYRSVDFISGTFLPSKRSEGILVERSDFDLMYLPCGSLGLFKKERKNKKKKLPFDS